MKMITWKGGKRK